VDRAAERLVTDVLLAAEPDSRIVGEELSPEVVTGGLVWIVDPLDGTTNFLHDFPSYAVSIAAAVDGELQAGVVLHVPRQEVFAASRGGGAWQGDRRLSVSTITDPAFALLGTGFPFKDPSQLAEYQAQFGRVAARTSGIRRPGSAALDLADVAAGRFDGFWEMYLSTWDIAAGSLLVKEAGGLISDFRGGDDYLDSGHLVCATPKVFKPLLQIVGRHLGHVRYPGALAGNAEPQLGRRAAGPLLKGCADALTGTRGIVVGAAHGRDRSRHRVRSL
jgi:myo-inositol-1(or 4)-monophosphatase